MISDIHVRGLQALAGVEVVGIADADTARARRKAAQYGIAGVFDTQRDLLVAARPDVVHLLTPPGSHAALCVEALEAGCHVYVEKPMAETVADCDRMIAAAERVGRQLCAGHCMVYDPLMQRALALLASGELGEVVHASAAYCFDPARIPGYRSKGWYRRLGGGFVEDLASHPASLLRHLLGRPEAVTALADERPAHAGLEIAALVRGAAGTGSLQVSLDARPEEVSLEIRATKGTVRLDFSSMVITVQRERGIPKKLAHGVKNIETAAQIAWRTVASTARVLAKRTDTTKGIHSLIAAFYAALREGAPAPVSGTEGRDVVQMLREIWPESPAEARRPSRWVLSRDGLELPEAQGSELVAPSRGNGSGAPATALVTGATGFIGRHLVRTLTERGLSVRALARDPARAHDLAADGVEVVIGDFGDPTVVDGLCEGIDLVFHLASVMRGSAEEFERVDLGGGRRLIAEAKRAGVRRFVFTSTMGAFALGGLRDGSVVTEDMEDDPERVGHYARAKLLLERELLEANAASELEAAITRPGLVFGDGISPFLEHLPHLGTLRGDRYVVFGDGEVPLQLTYVGNTVDALWRAATVPEAAGGVFTIIDDDPPTQREFVRALAGLTGRPLRVSAIPRAAAWMIGLGVETAAGLLKRKPPTTRRLLIGKTAKLAFDCRRAKSVLGWSPAVSWREGLRRAVEWSGDAPAAGRPGDRGDLGDRGDSTDGRTLRARAERPAIRRGGTAAGRVRS